jgi:hypothetical protein
VRRCRFASRAEAPPGDHRLDQPLQRAASALHTWQHVTDRVGATRRTLPTSSRITACPADEGRPNSWCRTGWVALTILDPSSLDSSDRIVNIHEPHCSVRAGGDGACPARAGACETGDCTRSCHPLYRVTFVGNPQRSVRTCRDTREPRAVNLREVGHHPGCRYPPDRVTLGVGEP